MQEFQSSPSVPLRQRSKVKRRPGQCRRLNQQQQKRRRQRLWLHSRHTVEVMLHSLTKDISGLAGQRFEGLGELVLTLVCSSPHPAMATYMQRPRKYWPSSEQMTSFLKQPMLLVMLGPKGADDSHLQFRVSWSHLEISLISTLPLWVKQGYVCFKYTIKSVLASLRTQNEDAITDGRSRIGRYHLKTVLLRYLEEHPPSQEGSPFQLMLDICQDLQHYVVMACLPHYFLPDCDLLRTLGFEERHYGIQALRRAIEDPLVAIVRSPSEPQDILGNNSPDDLMRCFRVLSSRSSSSQGWEDLQRLLCILDEHREGLHRKQLEKDGHWRATGQLVQLADLPLTWWTIIPPVVDHCFSRSGLFQSSRTTLLFPIRNISTHLSTLCFIFMIDIFFELCLVMYMHICILSNTSRFR